MSRFKLLFVLATGIMQSAQTSSLCDMLSGVNAHRTSKGLPTLRSDSRLDAAALAQCNLMKAANILAHSVDGSNPGDRISRTGYAWNACAENIYSESIRYDTDFQRALTGFIGSPEHEANMVGNYARMGSASCQNSGSTYWVQDFGSGDDASGEDSCSNSYKTSTTPPPPPPQVLQEASPKQANPPPIVYVATAIKSRPVSKVSIVKSQPIAAEVVAPVYSKTIAVSPAVNYQDPIIQTAVSEAPVDNAQDQNTFQSDNIASSAPSPIAILKNTPSTTLSQTPRSSSSKASATPTISIENSDAKDYTPKYDISVNASLAPDQANTTIATATNATSDAAIGPSPTFFTATAFANSAAFQLSWDFPNLFVGLIACAMII